MGPARNKSRNQVDKKEQKKIFKKYVYIFWKNNMKTIRYQLKSLNTIIYTSEEAIKTSHCPDYFSRLIKGNQSVYKPLKF